MKTIQILLLTVVLAGNADAGPAPAKLSALAESLIKGYSAIPRPSRTVLAIFPLNCGEKLEKQRAGFAASEVISHRFVADNGFTVVERGELHKLLSEQKLQASGIIDSDTAVKIGKILGANVILAGSIQKLGGRYQVNARLVDAGTSEILVSGYAELEESAFEEAARVYMSLVPEEQTLGIYGIYSYRNKAHKRAVFTEASFWGGTTTVWPRNFYSSLAGAGLLYRPGRNIQINAECATSLVNPQYSTAAGSWGYAIQNSLKITTVSLMVSYVARFSERWGYLAGLGMQRIALNSSGFDSMKYFYEPFIKSGIEFKPQNRIGFGLNLKYEMSDSYLCSENSTKIFELDPLSIESTLALYF